MFDFLDGIEMSNVLEIVNIVFRFFRTLLGIND